MNQPQQWGAAVPQLPLQQNPIYWQPASSHDTYADAVFFDGAQDLKDVAL